MQGAGEGVAAGGTAWEEDLGTSVFEVSTLSVSVGGFVLTLGANGTSDPVGFTTSISFEKTLD